MNDGFGLQRQDSQAVVDGFGEGAVSGDGEEGGLFAERESNMSEIKVVSNSEKNHLDELRTLFQSNANRLIIASPFLAPNITELLNEFTFANTESIELITTFKPKDSEQLTKPEILRDFFDFFKKEYPEIKVKLHINNQLHGKLYLRIDHSRRSLILSSANFTRNGLCNNDEWGLSVDDDTVIDEVINGLFESIEYHDVPYTQIKQACLQAEFYKRDHPEWIKKPDIFSDILDIVYTVENTSNTNPKFFLKPIGVTDRPILLKDQRDFSNLNQNLHFSKKKPKGVRKGDVLITVAVTAGSLLSYFKVTGGLQEVTKDEILRDGWKERWPWYLAGRNSSPGFGGQWWIHNIQREDVRKEFLELYPDTPVTSAGGFTLGAINFGADKVQITKEFADFLISKIKDAVK